ncbi:glycoside hydrolase N-terminal domain-containing protein [Fulvivirga maritima]|uniref:glycosyl hydrolase family 95 catalytic domain-containing protein n=1 Tax=Fulvivirga maritima TaxID=2904247 RepID=UPI001F15E467|nr:glycoside hydrolase N-terminal domain-containing protein [Fulvivirga maritima]UII24609.1 glycoside hydrolase N-terminal domain-containing protein [Fulvivirga maritima]
MRRIVLGIVIVISLGIISAAKAQNDLFHAAERGFTSWLPAPNWEHGLLTGNGTMGALVFGNPHEETIILSHGQLFLPRERSEQLFDQSSRMEEIKQLIKAGKYEEAAKIPVDIRKAEGYADERDPFIPAFDLKITQEAANISKYQRSTDFVTGEAKTTWVDDLGTFDRRVFVSRADSVIVLSITSDHPINCTIGFKNRPVNWDQWAFVGGHIEGMTAGASEKWLTYKSNFKKEYEGSIKSYEGVGKLILKGGASEVRGNELVIKEAEKVLLLIKIDLNYSKQQDITAALKNAINNLKPEYQYLLDRHTSIQGNIFSRTKLDLHSSKDTKSLHTEELLLNAAQNGVSKALIEKVFDAGRYNIISSTGANPPNLQGLWSGTWTAPWAADYTHDGNLPSAMASLMSGNMPELMSTYVNYMERYTPEFEHNAERLFDARGVVLPAHTSTSGWPTDFSETWCLTLWTGGAGWAADIMYNYYLYTGDKTYLKEHSYPWMKKVAWFYEDFLTEKKDGKYLFNPSYSPENNPANNSSQAAINATMDVMIAKQLLRNAITAGRVLGEDKKQLKKWETMLKSMPEYTVNEEGVLSEWLSPELEDNYRHRHVSQLYSLYNYMDPDILNKPILKEGAEKLIEKKLEFREDEGGGEMAFGLVQLGLSAAHLKDAEKAYDAVKWLSSKYWSSGMGSFHNVGNLLNTDISGGLPAVIIEMLVYAEQGKISLLPALPEEWPEGELSGVLLRGQVELKKMSWNSKMLEVELFSSVGQEVIIELPEEITNIQADGVKVNKIGVGKVRFFMPAKKGIKLKFTF